MVDKEPITKSDTKPAKVEIKKPDYPDVPEIASTKSYDVGIQEEPRGHFHSQLALYILVMFVVALIVVYLLLS